VDADWRGWFRPLSGRNHHLTVIGWPFPAPDLGWLVSGDDHEVASFRRGPPSRGRNSFPCALLQENSRNLGHAPIAHLFGPGLPCSAEPRQGRHDFTRSGTKQFRRIAGVILGPRILD
jgi:hypothetical protein